MKKFGVFSIKDIEKQYPGFLKLNLINWQKKGYIIKIRREWYCFSECIVDTNISWLAANSIYQPSYISLQTVLSDYNLIPESIFPITSITTNKTNSFSTSIANFTYNSIKESCFGFGHTLREARINIEEKSVIGENTSKKIVVATLEKAILDFFYIYSQYKSEKDMEDLRFEPMVLDQINKSVFYSLLSRFKSKALNKRIATLFKVYSIN